MIVEVVNNEKYVRVVKVVDQLNVNRNENNVDTQLSKVNPNVGDFTVVNFQPGSPLINGPTL